MSEAEAEWSGRLSELLVFQDNFLSLVHSQIYHSQRPFNQALIKFEIDKLSDINDKFGSAVADLIDRLVVRKIPYQMPLREAFQKMLKTEFLPMLRVNRYDLTKLSLYGFDIYVEPLEAVLQILGRMEDNARLIGESSVKLDKGQGREEALERGWDYYLLYAQYWKLSLNIYMLKEYLSIGSKSFVRKDRDIIFTGIGKLQEQLVPVLLAREGRMIDEVAQLNSALHSFHPNFDLFHFYSLLLPLKPSYQPLFATLQPVLEKCQRTNILTPMLFGLLRHKQHFLDFISQAHDACWLPYLNVIIAAIAINLKLRILEYKEIMQVFEAATSRAGLLGQIRIEEMVGKLDNEWKDAKEFFISAVKMGFSNSEVETWTMLEFDKIGSMIIDCTLSGMLLNPQANEVSLKMFLNNGGEILNKELKQLTRESSDKKSMAQINRDIEEVEDLLSLIRLVHLMKLFQFGEEENLRFLLSCFARSKASGQQSVDQAVNKAAQDLNEMLIKVSKNKDLTVIKQRIPEFHGKFHPMAHFEQLISLYFKQLQSKIAFETLFQILPLSDPELRKQCLVAIASQSIPLPGDKLIKVRTFDSEMLVKSDLINPPYQIHCLLSVLTTAVIEGKEECGVVLEDLVQICPWLGMTLLNFPVSKGTQLSSFSSHLVSHPQHHSTLIRLLQNSTGGVVSQEGTDLIKNIVSPGICDHLMKQINEKQDIQVLYGLCKLLLEVGAKTEERAVGTSQLLAVLLHLLERVSRPEDVKNVVNDICRTAFRAFKDHGQLWLAYLLVRKIQGKAEIGLAYRKSILKDTKSSFYFVSEIEEQKDSDQVLYQQSETLKKRFDGNQSSENNKEIEQVTFTFEKLNSSSFSGLRQVIDNSSASELQLVRNLHIPRVSKEIIKALIQSEQTSKLAFEVLSLNIENSSILTQNAIELQQQKILTTSRFTKNLNPQISSLLQLSSDKKIPIINQMSEHLSIHQRLRISEQFFIEASMVPLYCEEIFGIEYLGTLSSLNWRFLLQHFTRQLSSLSLPSLLLQFSQYVQITGEVSPEYSKIVSQQGILLKQLVTLFTYKLDSIAQMSTSEQQLNIRLVNQLSSLNLLLRTIQIKEVLSRLGTLQKRLKQRGLQIENTWQESLSQLNSKINTFFPGGIVFPDFVNGFALVNSSIYRDHNIELGVCLQDYYNQKYGELPQEQYYVPKSHEQFDINFFGDDAGEGVVIRNTKSSVLPIKDKYEKLLKELKESGLINEQESTLNLNFQSKAQSSESSKNIFYRLGCLHTALQQGSRRKLSPWLQLSLDRKKLDWQLLKAIRSQKYHHIKALLAEEDITQKNLTFTLDEEQLIPRGKEIRVTQYNLESYCNKIALQVIGTATLILHSQSFLRGVCQQRAQK